MFTFFQEFLDRFGQAYKKRIYTLLGLSVITGLLELGGIALIFPLIALVNDPQIVERGPTISKIYVFLGFENPKTMIYLVAIAIGIVFILKNLYMMFYQYLHLNTVKRWRDDICNHIMERYMRASYAYHLQRSSTALVSTLEFTVYFVLNSYIISMIVLLSNLIVAAMLIAYIIFSFPVPTLISGAVLTLLTVVQLRLIRRYSVKLGERVISARAANLAVLTQGLMAIKETKSFMKEQHFSDVYAKTNAEISEQDKKSLFMQFVPTYINEIVLVTTIIILCCMVLSGNGGIVSIANLAILAAVAFRLAPLANRAFYAFSQVQVSSASARTLMDEMIALDKAQIEAAPLLSEPLSFTKAIELRDIGFHYDVGKYALRHVNLCISKGEFIGIVGPSGAGKTTLVDIILGLLEFSEGEILIDGQSFTKERMHELRRITGYVSQSPYIFNGTVRENVAFGVPASEINDAAISEALKEASIDSFFRERPDYLDEKIADNGKSLSGGQRQRVAIARALYKNPDIIILDEATSALDTETEYEITRAINQLKGRKTILAIAHRLSTLKGCDRIVYMAEGKIVDCGTFAELNQRHVDFARMLELSSVT